MSRKLERVLLVYKKNFEFHHDPAITLCIASMAELSSELEFEFNYVARERVLRENFENLDLVVVLGGDGTFTSISHSVQGATMLGVNSHPRRAADGSSGSYGFYMSCVAENLRESLLEYVGGGGIVNKLPRLAAELELASGNRLRADYAINDLLICNTVQYHPAKYRLRRSLGDGDELSVYQSSSGLVFSTFYGQNAWFNKVVEHEVTDFDETDILQKYFIGARELDVRGRRREEVWDFTSQSTIIESDMHRGYVVPDGWDEYHFSRNSIIRVGLAQEPLEVITFDQSLREKVLANLP